MSRRFARKVAEAIPVTKTGTETLTNKTLTSPTITTPTVSGGTFTSPTLTTPSTSGGTLTSPTITSPTVSSGTFTNPAITVSTTGPATPAANRIYQDQIAEAWARIGATGSIVAKFNVASVTVSGVGVKKVVFARSFGAADSYVITGSVLATGAGYISVGVSGNVTASSCLIRTWTVVGGPMNIPFFILAKGRH